MRRMMRWWMAAVVLLSAAASLAGEKQQVAVTYVIGPARPLPEGLDAVAVIDAGVETQGVEQDDRERKWSSIAADMVEALLQEGRGYGAKLAVAKRRETAKILAERDLQLAGLVDGAAAVQAGQLLAVQGLITSRITIQLDVQRTTKTTIDWMSVMGGMIQGMAAESNRPPPPPRHYRDPRYTRDPSDAYARQRGYGRRPPPGYGPPPGSGGGLKMATREVEEISRSLSLHCVFSLIDAATGEALLQYSPPPIRKQDKASPNFFFGGSIDEADLDPVDHFIGELVEQAAREFVSQLVPVQVVTGYELEGKGKEGEAAIRMLRADELAGAIEKLQARCKKKDDEAESFFALAVTYELAGRPQEALEVYRRLLGLDDLDDEDELPIFMSAKNRLTAHLPRMLRPGGPAAADPEGGGEPTPAGQGTVLHDSTQTETRESRKKDDDDDEEDD